MLARNQQPGVIVDEGSNICQGATAAHTDTNRTLTETRVHCPVLVVDDSRTVLLFVKRALEEAGISTATANTVDATMAAISADQPDLILLDLSIAEHNKEALLQRLIQEGVFQRTRVILFSNRVEAVLEAAATRLGAAGYLRKSGIARHVVNVVSTELARSAGAK